MGTLYLIYEGLHVVAIHYTPRTQIICMDTRCFKIVELYIITGFTLYIANFKEENLTTSTCEG